MNHVPAMGAPNSDVRRMQSNPLVGLQAIKACKDLLEWLESRNIYEGPQMAAQVALREWREAKA